MTLRVPVTLDELRDAIQRLHQATPKYGLTAESLPQIVRVYREALEDFDRETIDGAAKMLVRTQEKFPTPATWRDKCREWLRHNRIRVEWATEEDREGRSIVCRTCRSVARFARLQRADGSEYARLIAPCDPERHTAGQLLVPLPPNFLHWSA